MSISALQQTRCDVCIFFEVYSFNVKQFHNKTTCFYETKRSGGVLFYVKNKIVFNLSVRKRK